MKRIPAPRLQMLAGKQNSRLPDDVHLVGGCFVLVREGGVEPPRPHGHTDLNRARLPIPPLARKVRGYHIHERIAMFSARTFRVLNIDHYYAH